MRAALLGTRTSGGRSRIRDLDLAVAFSCLIVIDCSGFLIWQPPQLVVYCVIAQACDAIKYLQLVRSRKMFLHPRPHRVEKGWQFCAVLAVPQVSGEVQPVGRGAVIGVVQNFAQLLVML